ERGAVAPASGVRKRPAESTARPTGVSPAGGRTTGSAAEANGAGKMLAFGLGSVPPSPVVARSFELHAAPQTEATTSAAIPSKGWVLRTRGFAAYRGPSLPSGGAAAPPSLREPPPSGALRPPNASILRNRRTSPSGKKLRIFTSRAALRRRSRSARTS